jgi:hypothetical protein
MGALTGISGDSGNSGIITNYVPAAPQSEVTTYIANVVTAGGTVTIRQPLDDMVAFAKNAGVFSLIQKWFFPSGPDSFTGSMVPLVDTTATGNFTNVNFVSGDWSTSGLQGVHSSSKYINTGFTPSLHFASVDSFCVTVHADLENFAARQFDYPRLFGCKISNTQWLQIEQNDTTYYSGKGFTNAASANGPGNQLVSRNIALNRSTSTLLDLYNNGTVTATSGGTNSAVAPSIPIFLYAENNLGTPGDFSSSKILSCTMGPSMTQTQIQALNSALALYRAVKGI